MPRALFVEYETWRVMQRKRFYVLEIRIEVDFVDELVEGRWKGSNLREVERGVEKVVRGI